MKWLALMLLVIALQGQANPSTSGLSRIHFTALSCGGEHEPAYKPRIVVDNLGARREEKGFQYSVRATSLGIEGDLFLPPGFYNVGIKLDSDCQNAILLPVLSGRGQDVLFVGLHGFTLRDSTNMVAGTLPFSGYTASIEYWPAERAGHGTKTLVPHPARVQGDSFYATGLWSGTVRLRISTPDSSNRLEFEIGKIGVGAQRFTIFNVSPQDVRNALEHPLSP